MFASSAGMTAGSGSPAEGRESARLVGDFTPSVYAAIDNEPNAYPFINVSSGRPAALASPAM